MDWKHDLDAIIGGFGGFVVRHRVSLRDLAIIAFLLLIATFYAYEIDIFQHAGQSGPVENVIETDEILMLGGLLMAALLVFSMRRYGEQKRETQRRIAAEREARRLAYQDALTGLPNRRQIEEAIAIAVESPPKLGATHGLFMMDLNGFKRINDTYGHGRGDEVLAIIAQRLMRAVRNDDIAARMGGDEFCILSRNLSGIDAAASLAMRVIEMVSEEIVIDGAKHDIGTGIGIAFIPHDADTLTEALRKADVALYRAKAERRSALRFFEADMDKSVKEKALIEQLLRDAISHDRILARYRPTLDIVSGRVTGFQIIPEIEIPADLDYAQTRILAVAEETGMSHQIAKRVLRLGCEAARTWGEAVTLSFDLFDGQPKDENLASSILEIVAESGLSAARLEVGIDESVIARDVTAVKRALAPLQEAGARIALVNFGTGYSNLYHMQAIKLDRVKIDGRFMEGGHDDEALKMARALAGLGHGLGMQVTAVGKTMPGPDDGLRGAGVQEFQWSGIAMSTSEALRLVQMPARRTIGREIDQAAQATR